MSLKRINKVSYNRMYMYGMRLVTVRHDRRNSHGTRQRDAFLSEQRLVFATRIGTKSWQRKNDDAVWNAWWIIERGIAVQ
jgi:hypothetical protein